MVERLSPIPVVLLTVTLFDDSRQEVNDAITLVAAQFPNVRVLDWGNIAAADAAKILRGDGHHLTNDGRLVLASTVAGVMGKAPEEPGKCLSTSFSNDAGASVNGTDDPPPRPVGPTTTVKAPTATTKPPTATTTPPTSPIPTAPPVITAIPSPTSSTTPATEPPPAGGVPPSP
jgi:hypothetical protein